MSMTVVIRPAALYTQAMFATFAVLEKNTRGAVDLSLDSSADLVGEMNKWVDISSTSHEGPWQLAQHFSAAITSGASDASSVAWGCVVYTAGDPFEAGGVFPSEWLPKHINQKETYASYNLLLQFCQRYPDGFRRTQVLIDVDYQPVVSSFNRGRAKNRVWHEFLVALYDLQIEYGFLLSLSWVPTASNGVADAISWRSREAVVQLAPAAFRSLWEALGPFNIDLMACAASAQCSPDTGAQLPFFSRYHCAGTSGVDVVAQNLAVLPGTDIPAFGFCFPPPVMVGHVVQRLEECRAHAVILVPGMKSYWFPRVQLATSRSVPVSATDTEGAFVLPSPHGVLRPWSYPRWSMIAYEVDFR